MSRSATESHAFSQEQRVKMFRTYVRAQGMLDLTRLEMLGHSGLTVMELRVISLLSARRFALAGTIAESLRVRPSTATGIVDRLVRQGLVVRQRDREDRRTVRISLAGQGKKLIWELQKQNVAVWERLLEGLTPDEIGMIAQSIDLIVEAAERQGLIRPLSSNEDAEDGGEFDEEYDEEFDGDDEEYGGR